MKKKSDWSSIYHQMILYSLSILVWLLFFFFFSSRRRHTRFDCDWSSDVCSSDLGGHWGIPQPSDPCANRPAAPGGYFHGFPESQTRLLLAVGGNGEPGRIVHRTHFWLIVRKRTTS